jgi:hypothetical protein
MATKKHKGGSPRSGGERKTEEKIEFKSNSALAFCLLLCVLCRFVAIPLLHLLIECRGVVELRGGFVGELVERALNLTHAFGAFDGV